MCLDREQTHALVPCGHRCVCAACGADIALCPICRAPVARVLEIFDVGGEGFDAGDGDRLAGPADVPAEPAAAPRE